MGKLKNNQSGFGAIETILVLVIIVILVGVGWYVWHSKKNANTSYNNAASSQTVTKPAKKLKTTTTSPYAGWKTYSDSHVSYKYPTGWTAGLGPDKVATFDDMVTSPSLTTSAVTTIHNPGTSVSLLLQLDPNSSVIPCNTTPCKVTAVTPINNTQLPNTALATVDETDNSGAWSQYVVVNNDVKVGNTTIHAAKVGGGNIYLWGEADYTAKDGTVGDAAHITDTTAFLANSYVKDLVSLINSVQLK